jgi:hypothetical protein
VRAPRVPVLKEELARKLWWWWWFCLEELQAEVDKRGVEQWWRNPRIKAKLAELRELQREAG